MAEAIVVFLNSEIKSHNNVPGHFFPTPLPGSIQKVTTLSLPCSNLSSQVQLHIPEAVISIYLMAPLVQPTAPNFLVICLKSGSSCSQFLLCNNTTFSVYKYFFAPCGFSLNFKLLGWQEMLKSVIGYLSTIMLYMRALYQ